MVGGSVMLRTGLWGLDADDIGRKDEFIATVVAASNVVERFRVGAGGDGRSLSRAS